MEQKKHNYSKIRFLLVFAAVVGVLAVTNRFGHFCEVKEKPATAYAESLSEEGKDAQETSSLALLAEAGEEGEEKLEDFDEFGEDEADGELEITEEDLERSNGNPELSDGDSEGEDNSQVANFVSTKVWSYTECFPDQNDVQLEVAQRNGVRPMESRRNIRPKVRNMLLSDISHSPFYALDPLTHSAPYLVPKAEQLLNTIGLNFLDSLRAKQMPLHLPIVTSVLRTVEDIRGLQQGNGNSVENSCHCYGTTVDITYHRFMPLAGGEPTRYDDALKKTLAEVLFDLRDQGRCYVKYEIRQACFHLTVI